jgi:hypothetical protein
MDTQTPRWSHKLPNKNYRDTYGQQDDPIILLKEIRGIHRQMSRHRRMLRQTVRWSHKPPFNFQNKESMLIKGENVWRTHEYIQIRKCYIFLFPVHFSTNLALKSLPCERTGINESHGLIWGYSEFQSYHNLLKRFSKQPVTRLTKR